MQLPNNYMHGSNKMVKGRWLFPQKSFITVAFKWNLIFLPEKILYKSMITNKTNLISASIFSIIFHLKQLILHIWLVFSKYSLWNNNFMWNISWKRNWRWCSNLTQCSEDLKEKTLPSVWHLAFLTECTSEKHWNKKLYLMRNLNLPTNISSISTFF